VFEPGVHEQRTIGNDFMTNGHVSEIVQSSFLGAGAYAATPSVRDVLSWYLG
jgi:NTE family protein